MKVMDIINKYLKAPARYARKHRYKEWGRQAAISDITKYGVDDAEDWLDILERDLHEDDIRYAAGYREVVERARSGADIIGGKPSNLKGRE